MCETKREHLEGGGTLTLKISRFDPRRERRMKENMVGKRGWRRGRRWVSWKGCGLERQWLSALHGEEAHLVSPAIWCWRPSSYRWTGHEKGDDRRHGSMVT